MSRIEEACVNVRAVGSRVAHWMGQQPAVGEESITDWVLFELYERLPWVRYRKFNRVEESRESGADWDWWFVSNSGALGLRVQAKKVITALDQYRGLAHTNRRGLQIEMLLESARSAHLLPFYALYHRPSASPPVLCKASPLLSHKAEGIFLADGTTVYTQFIKGGRNPVSAEQLIATSNPLSCTFCCPLAIESDKDGPARIRRQLVQYHPSAAESNGPRTGWHEEVPAHVQYLLAEPRNEPSPEWDAQFAHQSRSTNAILVFDLRET